MTASALAEIKHNIEEDEERICHALMGHGRCTRKRLSGSCRGETGHCLGYKILTTSGGIIHGKTLVPIPGATKDPIFPARTLHLAHDGNTTFQLARAQGVPTSELTCNRFCGSGQCISKIKRGGCPSAVLDRIRCRSRQGLVQNVTELLRKHCPKTPCVVTQLAGVKPGFVTVPSNN